MRATNQPCSAVSSASPSSRMRAWTRGESFQRSLTASSPPTWMYSPGKSVDHFREDVFEEAER